MRDPGSPKTYSEEDVRRIVALASGMAADGSQRLSREDVRDILAELDIEKSSVDAALDEYDLKNEPRRVSDLRVRLFGLGAALSSVDAAIWGLIYDEVEFLGGPGASIMLLASGATAMLGARGDSHRVYWIRNALLWGGYAAVQVLTGVLNGAVVSDIEYGGAIALYALSRWVVTSVAGSLLITGRNLVSKSGPEHGEVIRRESVKVRIGSRLKVWIDRWMQRARDVTDRRVVVVARRTLVESSRGGSAFS